jgi:hypothetical protein
LIKKFQVACGVKQLALDTYETDKRRRTGRNTWTCLTGEAFTDGVASIVRQVRIFGERFQLIVHCQKKAESVKHKYYL